MLQDNINLSLFQDHMIKKLSLIFWEIVPKTEPDGRLKHEMILVCDVAHCVCISLLIPLEEDVCEFLIFSYSFKGQHLLLK